MTLDIVGRWDLVRWQTTLPGGGVLYPFGEKAGGSVIYTPGGWMAGQLWAADRRHVSGDNPLGGSAEDRAAAYSSYVAYTGSYEVAEDHIVHRVTASLFPNWVGDGQIRYHDLDGDRLILRTPAVDVGHGVGGNELTWVRAERW